MERKYSSLLPDFILTTYAVSTLLDKLILKILTYKMLLELFLILNGIQFLTALPMPYGDDLESPIDKSDSPTHEELKEFFEFLQRLNLRHQTTDEDVTVALPRFYLPSQSDDDNEEFYSDNPEDSFDQPEYFDYPRYIPYMPVKKRSFNDRYESFGDYDDNAAPRSYPMPGYPFPRYEAEEPQIILSEDEQEHHPDALRELETLLNDKRHNSDDSVRQLHSLLNAKAKRSAPTEFPVANSDKQNKTGNSIVVTVYESEQAANEKATVSKDGQKEVPLLRPALIKHKTAPVVESVTDDDYEQNLEESVRVESQNRKYFAEALQRVEQEEGKREGEDGSSSEPGDFSGRLRKRFITPTDSLMNELHGLRHE